MPIKELIAVNYFVECDCCNEESRPFDIYDDQGVAEAIAMRDGWHIFILVSQDKLYDPLDWEATRIVICLNCWEASRASIKERN